MVRTARPACLGSPSPDAALEEALRAPLPVGPPPKKPPRTFQHDAFLFLERAGKIDVTDGSERPLRRSPEKPQRPVSIAVVPFVMNRSKTELSLLNGRKKKQQNDEDVEWLDSFQWNGFSPERQLGNANGRRRMSCDGKQQRQQTDAVVVTPQQPHVYDQPSNDGDLHYMVFLL